MSLLKAIWSDELYIFHSEYANIVSLYQKNTTTYFFLNLGIKGGGEMPLLGAEGRGLGIPRQGKYLWLKG